MVLHLILSPLVGILILGKSQVGHTNTLIVKGDNLLQSRLRVSYGGKQDGSRMIVVCVGLGAYSTTLPGKILNLDLLGLLLMQSGTNFPNNT